MPSPRTLTVTLDTNAVVDFVMQLDRDPSQDAIVYRAGCEAAAGESLFCQKRSEDILLTYAFLQYWSRKSHIQVLLAPFVLLETSRVLRKLCREQFDKVSSTASPGPPLFDYFKRATRLRRRVVADLGADCQRDALSDEAWTLSRRVLTHLEVADAVVFAGAIGSSTDFLITDDKAFRTKRSALNAKARPIASNGSELAVVNQRKFMEDRGGGLGDWHPLVRKASGMQSLGRPMGHVDRLIPEGSVNSPGTGQRNQFPVIQAWVFRNDELELSIGDNIEVHGLCESGPLLIKEMFLHRTATTDLTSAKAEKHRADGDIPDMDWRTKPSMVRVCLGVSGLEVQDSKLLAVPHNAIFFPC